MRLKAIKKDIEYTYIENERFQTSETICFSIYEAPTTKTKVLQFSDEYPFNVLKGIDWYEKNFDEKFIGVSLDRWFSNRFSKVFLLKGNEIIESLTLLPTGQFRFTKFFRAESFQTHIYFILSDIKSNIDLNLVVDYDSIECKQYLTENGIVKIPAVFNLVDGKIDHELFYIDSLEIKPKFEIDDKFKVVCDE